MARTHLVNLLRRSAAIARVAQSTGEPLAEAVIDEPRIAIRTGEAVAAGAAKRERRVAAAVEKQQHLPSQPQLLFHRRQQGVGQARL